MTRPPERVKLPPGPCSYCGQIIRIQKFWCSPECEVKWEKELKAKYTDPHYKERRKHG
jgi:hypothetical protein